MDQPRVPVREVEVDIDIDRCHIGDIDDIDFAKNIRVPPMSQNMSSQLNFEAKIGVKIRVQFY